MTVEEQMKSIIIQNYKSVRAFTQAIDVPYSTIDSMLKKGIAGTGIQTVLKVCHALNLDVESIQSGELKYKDCAIEEKKIEDLSTNEIKEEEKVRDLSTDEIKIIKKYRLLDQRGKQTVNDTLERELSYILRDNNMVEMSEIASDAIDTIDKIAEAIHKNQHNTVLKK